MAARIPKKVAVIGFDAAFPAGVLKHVEAGALPNFKKLIEEGAWAENCLVPYPTITPPNWTTLATGAWPGTHGITDFDVWKPGNSLGMDGCHQGFNRDDCLVENIWEAAERAGKKSIVLNWPAAWPSTLKNGIVVGGNSLSIDDWRPADIPGHEGRFAVCSDMSFSTVIYARNVIKAEISPAEGWKNLPKAKGKEPLEAELDLSYPASMYEMAPTTWYLLIEDSQGKGYDRALLCPSRDYKQAFCTLPVGQWSEQLRTTVKTKKGEVKEVLFHTKLLELAKDGSDFRLFSTGLAETSGFTNPPEVAKEISENVRVGDPSLRGGGIRAFQNGLIDLDTHCEMTCLSNDYLGGIASYLLKNKEWDIFYIHNHTPDWIYHAWLTEMDPIVTKDKATNQKFQDAEKKAWISLDTMLGKIVEAAGKDVLFALVSDHGATASGDHVPVMDALVKNGLIKVDENTAAELMKIKGGEAGFAAKGLDWSKVKAIPQRVVHIFVNLKGRDPEGIVDPKDYDSVRQEVIDALMTYVDPKTGKRPFALAVRREDARPWGNYGERCGDVVYAVYPWYGDQHGYHLPTAEWGLGSLKVLFVLSGPGIKKGTTLSRTVWITDLVPTICYLMDLPYPDNAEGAVIFQALKDPNFKQEELNKLKDAISRMETALARQAREPWDKHDCA